MCHNGDSTSAWDVAAAAASCEDGRGEEDVHNGDAGERAGYASESASGRLRRGWPRLGTTAAAAVNLKPTAGANLLAAGAGGDEGRRAAPRDVDVVDAGSAAAGTSASDPG